MSKNLEKAVKSLWADTKNFLKWTVLFPYAFPTLGRINYENSHKAKNDRYLYNYSSRPLGPKTSFILGTILGSIPNSMLIRVGSMMGVSDEVSLAGLFLPVLTNGISSIYESRRLKRNQELVIGGDYELAQIIKELRNKE